MTVEQLKKLLDTAKVDGETQKTLIAEIMKAYEPSVTALKEAEEKNKQLTEASAQAQKDLEALKSTAGASDELKKQVDELMAKNKEAETAYNAELQKIRMDRAMERALVGAKARNHATVKPLLADFLEKAQLDGDNIPGLGEKLKELAEAEDTKFLFAGDEKPRFEGIGEPRTAEDGGSQPVSDGERLGKAAAEKAKATADYFN